MDNAIIRSFNKLPWDMSKSLGPIETKIPIEINYGQKAEKKP